MIRLTVFLAIAVLFGCDQHLRKTHATTLESKCKANLHEYCGIPFVVALNNPDELDGKKVLISGYIRKWNLGWYLFQSKEHGVHSDHASMFRIYFDESASSFLNVPLYKNSWVSVAGTFRNTVDDKGAAWAVIETERVTPSTFWEDSIPPPPPKTIQ